MKKTTGKKPTINMKNIPHTYAFNPESELNGGYFTHSQSSLCNQHKSFSQPGNQ